MPEKGQKHSLNTKLKIGLSRKGIEAWNKGKAWNNLIKCKIGISKAGVFDFIKDKKLQELLVRNFAIAEINLKNDIPLASAIFYASVIEGVLGYLLNSPNDRLDNLIELALDKKIISKGEYHKLNMIRDFRNYIHIRKEIDEDMVIDSNIANTVSQLCHSILRKMSSNAKFNILNL